MAFCRFCGKDLIDGQCDCELWIASIKNVEKNNESNGEDNPYQQYYQKKGQQPIYQQVDNSGQVYQQPYQKRQEPILISSFKPNFSSFSGFISSIRDLSGISEASSSSNDPYEYNVPIVPDCVKPEENEVVIKQYNIARLRTRLKFMKSEGRLMITNRRVLFRAAGTSLTGNLLQEHEFELDKIAGIELHKDYKFSFLNLLGSVLIEALALFIVIAGIAQNGKGDGNVPMGVIMGILGLVPTFIVYKHAWIKLLSAGISVASFQLAISSIYDKKGLLLVLFVISSIIYFINLIIVCFVPNLIIKIKSSGAESAIHIGGRKSLFHRMTGTGDYSGFAEVLPWEDTVMAINEIGALIDDLKKQGDYAIEKWSK